ncbi:hypothetical protein RN22_11030 [Grimontia sp. AD028]|uniref:DUF6678 family protein n=1 Tax=Grimontia sp. AD028 TaxID=1581149 RepID=UPI00061B24B8|nr:DUF6678 family protein [Grimontia sp. AD028]KKD60398.1 hypothetical protein RN22_11030 [Grimontia sp. AD028]
MNNTKWRELRKVMSGLGTASPQWKVKILSTGYQSNWDGDWCYHFADDNYSDIEWVEIKVDGESQRSLVLNALKNVHVAGSVTEDGYRIYGYVSDFSSVDYL